MKLKALPAVVMTVVSMVLTLGVVVMWLGGSMPVVVAVVVGLGIDGGWLATLAYDRRLAAQGDHNSTVTAIGWMFGAVATGVLVAHALGQESPWGWLALSWFPLGAKAAWLVHGLWEQTALTPDALKTIRDIQQQARDKAAVSRARLRAHAATEETRLTAVTGAGARVARVQARTAQTLSAAWSTLEATQQHEDEGRALASVTADGPTSWELPVWGPIEPVTVRAAQLCPPDDETDDRPANPILPTATNTEESTQSGVFQSGADVPESTPVTVTLTRLPVPDPIPVDAGKSTLPLKPAHALTAPVGSAPVTPIRSTRPVAAESTRPLRATFKVPESAKSSRPRRTREQLLTEAMELTEGWPQTDITAERLRREMRISPERARMLRDVLLGKHAPAEEASA